MSSSGPLKDTEISSALGKDAAQASPNRPYKKTEEEIMFV
jgi:hypothetical protein